jgi:putative flippase GtrA
MTTHRTAVFVTVAALGFGVQIAAIALLTSVAGIPVPIATAVGVMIAMVHNFAWHERWTWADRTTPSTPLRTGSGHAIARLMKFAASVGFVSLTGTVVLTTLYVSLLRIPVVLANLLAVWSTAFLNYLVLDRVIYQELES